VQGGGDPPSHGGGLRNVHPELAQAVADGLGMTDLPEPLPAAREPRTDLAESPALSILGNGPDSFAGRKLGVLITDGIDGELLAQLRSAAEERGVTVELVAPSVGGVTAADGSAIAADEKVDGAPSVLYDAVVVLTDTEGAAKLADLPPARDFVNDAFAHCKYIGYCEAAASLFDAVGVGGQARRRLHRAQQRPVRRGPDRDVRRAAPLGPGGRVRVRGRRGAPRPGVASQPHPAKGSCGSARTPPSGDLRLDNDGSDAHDVDRGEAAEVVVLRPDLGAVHECRGGDPGVVDPRLATGGELIGRQAGVGGGDAFVGRQARGLLAHARQRREPLRARVRVACDEDAELELGERHD
jgi:C-terminal domain found in long catalases